MARSKSLPQFAVRVPTYAELEHYVGAFAQGHLNLLLIIGPPGVGKSRCVRHAMAGPIAWIGGQASPLSIYMQAYLHRDQPIILDDVDGLYADRQGVRLLKALAQTEPRKTLSWYTQTPILERHAVPCQFTTASRVTLIGNDWKTLNADVAALEDRGHVVIFEPTALEVHRQAARWFWDQEIFDLVGAYLHLMERHSLRGYVNAWELKQAGLDWRQGILSRCLSGAALAVAKLRANPAFASEAERVQAFVQSGAGCRATYFNHAKKLQPPADTPRIVLTHTRSPTSGSTLDYLERLRRRYGHLGNG